MKFIIGNWKMNGDQKSLKSMLTKIKNAKTKNTIILAVPYTLLKKINIPNIFLGAQDISEHSNGAYTGDVSAHMLTEHNIKYTIVGHSERRFYYKETNNIVCEKANRAIENNICPIICVGETLTEKRHGKTEQILKTMVMESVPNKTKKSANIIIAYEPRWAIGAGITPTESEIANAHDIIKKTLKSMGYNKIPIIYGASINKTNINTIIQIKNVDGVLVGGSSLQIKDFLPIIENVK